MNHRHGQVHRCTVYHGHGEPLSETCMLAEGSELVRQASSPDHVELRQIMSDEVICARGSLRVSAVIQLMLKHHVGCLPIVDSRRHPIGVITKLDLVEQLESASEVRARTAEELMMPLALTLPEHSKVAHAAAMMVLEDTHHVLVVSNTGALTGVVSTYDIVRWLVENDRLSSEPARDVPREQS